ncbi:UNVERIFIED_ORG: MFS family permease [Kosakonia oryzae]|uniref:Major Facilitator Superfamily protein n=2 Tax=Kosakonia radicincitans TaxID=283686 RepID=A0AAX2EP32_9ENTR|nr:MFS transporter [Kosakonia radicincitans]MDP9567068.1 MFS family permease [Kosakonia oryzae]SFE73618.1 Major Facilitator Superfamily protein [Kosakonia radicincitans]SFR03398.1 Major Facilitator Superfamily protein [Kosakonia radicincitans]SFT58408.1 Major Facilitator Superfamily protein [Kosakonia radicincitans]SFX31398.1 Major Facilitator Superfamily protein [Kosakonia radicincitans]
MANEINPAATPPKATRKEVIAVVLGAAVEFFDFSAYATFAVMIGHVFFPSDNPFTSLLLSVSVFGIGFIVRPLGAIFIGSYADRVGRKPAMLLTMVFMTIGTGGLVFLPGYETIGMAAPVLLVLVRMLQGLAWGGEAGPATTFIMEAAPAGKRAFYTSWQIVAQGLAGISAGVIGYTLTVLLSPHDLVAWGWRVPFAFGLLILPIAIYLRRNLRETYQSDNSEASHSTGSLLGEVVKNYRGLVLTGIFILSGSTITQYFLNYMTTYALNELAFTPGSAMASTILIGVCVVVFSLVGGWMADRVGRKMTIIAPRLILLLLLLPGLEIINTWRSEMVFYSVITVFAALQCISGSGVLVVLCENFPKYVRSTGFSIAFAFGITLFGGTAQIVFSWLIKVTGNPVSPGYYLIAANILCLAATVMLKERKAPQPLLARRRTTVQ